MERRQRAVRLTPVVLALVVATAMGQTVVQHHSATTETNTSVAVALTGVAVGDWLVVDVSTGFDATINAPSDTAGDSYALAVSKTVTDTYSANAATYYANAKSGGSITVTCSVGGVISDNVHCHVYEVSGLLSSSPLDVTGAKLNASGTSMNVATSAATTAADYCHAFFGSNNALDSFTAGSGWGDAETTSNTACGGTCGDSAFSEDRKVSSGGAVTATATANPNADTWTGVISCYKPGSAYYVSPSGNDSNPGTLSQPFQTLGRAQSAMQGSSTKTTYLRAGTYNNIVNFSLTSADNGETWANYPGDPANSAILDGGNSPGNDVLDINGGSNITISGLQVQNFSNSGIAICGGSNHCGAGTPAANGNVLINNVLHDFYSVNGGGLSVFGLATNTKIYNNVVYNSTSRGIEAVANQSGDGISGTDIENNVLLNTCTANSDEGAIYLQDNVSPPTSTNLTIKNNFIRDYGASPNNKGIYLDDGTSNATVTQNIIAGTGQFGVAVHQGNNNIIKDNIIDIGGGGNHQLMLYQDNSPGKTLTNMLGNSFTSNIIVNTGTMVASAFEAIICCSTENPTVQNDVYHNYSGGPINYQGDPTTVPTFNDSNPVLEDPQCSGWTYSIASGSPVFNAPVNFPGIPGAWGPPGYAIPQTGTAPSCPH